MATLRETLSAPPDPTLDDVESADMSLPDSSAVVKHPDGFYWLTPDCRQQFGPFAPKGSANWRCAPSSLPVPPARAAKLARNPSRFRPNAAALITEASRSRTTPRVAAPTRAAQRDEFDEPPHDSAAEGAGWLIAARRSPFIEGNVRGECDALMAPR